MPKKLTTEEFIAKAKSVHEDRYYYGKVHYTDSQTKVVITCPIHGDFLQTPAHHLHGTGCAKCATHKTANSLRLSRSEFVNRASILHNYKYTYDTVEYVNSTTNVVITCSIHGDFEQTPKNHLKGAGCPHCAGNLPKTTEEFIGKAVKVHNNQYDYSNVQYKNTDTKVIIICKEHGEFMQTPHSHLDGTACPKCADTRKTTKEFIKIANEVHNGKYTYEKTNYINTATKVTITCPIHGDWEQTPNAHTIKKQGCPSCAESGFDKSKPAILYYLKINGGQAYKIGITNRSVNERFNNSDLQLIEIIKTWYYKIGSDAYDKEQEILKKYKEFQYSGPAILLNGNTELFDKDVLELS